MFSDFLLVTDVLGTSWHLGNLIAKPREYTTTDRADLRAVIDREDSLNSSIAEADKLLEDLGKKDLHAIETEKERDKASEALCESFTKLFVAFEEQFLADGAINREALNMLSGLASNRSFKHELRSKPLKPGQAAGVTLLELLDSFCGKAIEQDLKAPAFKALTTIARAVRSNPYYKSTNYVAFIEGVKGLAEQYFGEPGLRRLIESLK